MPAPSTANDFLDLTRRSGLLEESRLEAYFQQLQSHQQLPSDAARLAGFMVRDGLLTFFQAEQLLLGKWKRFKIGQCRVLEKLGTGEMGQVFLCEHMILQICVAVKILPPSTAADPASLEQFYREAHAIAVLDHPNSVRIYE